MSPEVNNALYDLRDAMVCADIELALEEWWKLFDLLNQEEEK